MVVHVLLKLSLAQHQLSLPYFHHVWNPNTDDQFLYELRTLFQRGLVELWTQSGKMWKIELFNSTGLFVRSVGRPRKKNGTKIILTNWPVELLMILFASLAFVTVIPPIDMIWSPICRALYSIGCSFCFHPEILIDEEEKNPNLIQRLFSRGTH